MVSEHQQRVKYNENEIIDLYKSGLNMKQVASKIGICEDTVSSILKRNSITLHNGHSNRINQYDLQNNYIQSFFGATEAIQSIIKEGKAASVAGRRHITECCTGKNKTAYGYIWKYEIIN